MPRTDTYTSSPATSPLLHNRPSEHAGQLRVGSTMAPAATPAQRTHREGDEMADDNITRPARRQGSIARSAGVRKNGRLPPSEKHGAKQIPPKGTGARSVVAPENLGQEGEQSNIKRNTTGQGRRQDRI